MAKRAQRRQITSSDMPSLSHVRSDIVKIAAIAVIMFALLGVASVIIA